MTRTVRYECLIFIMMNSLYKMLFYLYFLGNNELLEWIDEDSPKIKLKLGHPRESKTCYCCTMVHFYLSEMKNKSLDF